MENLKNQIDETRRELARLNEPRPAADLDQAGKALDNVQQKVQNGENPDPQQQQKIKEGIDRAKNEVKMAQEELLREQLVRIADHLEGLKLRQQSAVTRSEDFQVKIVERKSWLTPYLATMEGNIAAQKMIADETDSVKDKLEQAKVFQKVLEKAKNSMDDAADVMQDRLKDAPDRLYLEVGAELMPEGELKEEGEKHEDTVRHQKRAVKRLDILLESIKDEINRMQAKKEPPRDAKDPDKGKQENKDPQPKQGGDGMPPNAQLKALYKLHQDLNERFEEFAAKNPNPDKLDPDQKKAFNQLTAEQAELHQLFIEITPNPAQQQPAVDPNKEKEGDKK